MSESKRKIFTGAQKAKVALEARGVGFCSLTESIDTTTSGGRLIFHVFGALGQFERDLIRERTKAGLAAAAARG
jgi:DNA invertase Pin-like site-specific DNA recombinase